MMLSMNTKELLLVVTVLGIVTVGSVILPSKDITITQALGQESTVSNSNSTSTTTIDAIGTPLYN